MRISSLTTQTRLPSPYALWGPLEYPQVLIYGWLIVCPLLFGGVDLWARAIQWTLVGTTLLYLAWMDPAAFRVFRGVFWLVGLFLAWTLVAIVPLPVGIVEALCPSRIAGMEHTMRSGESFVTFSYEPARTIDRFLMVSSCLISLMFFAHWASYHGGRKRLIWMILLSGAGVILVAWLNHLTPGHIYSRKIDTPGYLGPFTGRNIFADYMALTSLVGIGFLFQRWWPLRGTTHKSYFSYLALLIVACSVVMMLASGSRGACVAWVIGLVVFGVVLWLVDVEARRSLGVFIGLFLVAGLTFAYAHTLIQRFEVLGLKHGADGRTVTWEQTVKMGSEHWWTGVGLGNFPVAFPQYQPPRKESYFTHPENEYLEWWSETGIVGSLLIVLVIVAVCRRLLIPRKWKDLEWQAGALAALVALMVHSLVDFPLHIPSNAYLAAAILGLAWGNVMRNPDDTSAPVWKTTSRLAAVAMGALLLVAGVAAGSGEWLAGHGRAGAARKAWPFEPRYFDDEIEAHLTRLEYLPAHRLAQEGLRSNPCDWRLYYVDGWSLAPLYRKTDQARSAFNKSVYWTPAKTETARKAGLFFWPRRADISVSFWNQSLETEPEQDRAYYIFLQRTSNVPGQLELARVLAGKNVDRLMVLGDWMAESGSPEKLAEIIESALVNPPADVKSREKLVYLLLKVERLQEAQNLLDQTPQKTPLLKFYQAELYRYQKRWPKALQLYRSLGNRFQETTRVPKLAGLSLESLVRRSESEPDNSQIRNAYAWKLMKVGRAEEAEKVWAEVGRRWPDDHPEAYVNQAACLEHLGRLEEASQAWKIYLSRQFRFGQPQD